MAISDHLAAREIVRAIIGDFTGRRGLRQEWEQIDLEIREEIEKAWIAAAIAVLEGDRDDEEPEPERRARVEFGPGKTKYGPGVNINLTGDEVAVAIDAYLVAHGIHVNGSRTITVNGELCRVGRVYVDPSGFVIADGKKFSGRGGESR